MGYRMRRIGIIGLSLIAAMALGAVAAGTAQATPELGQCIKLGKYTIPAEKHGDYEDAACLKLAVKEKKGVKVETHKGHYEWRPGPPLSCEKLAKPKGKWKDAACTERPAKAGHGEYEKVGVYDNGPAFTASGGVAKLKVPQKAITTNCTAYTAAGDVTSATEGTVTANFVGCEVEPTKETCKSAHAPSGTITTNLLHTVISEPVSLYYGERFTPQSGAYLAEYECGNGKTAGRVSNYLVAHILRTSAIIDKMGTRAEEAAAPDEIEQDLTEEFSFNGGSFGPALAGTQYYNATIEYASEVELRIEAPERVEEFE